MITPTVIPQPTRLRANVNAENLATLIGSVQSSGIIALPEGKTLADVKQLNLNVLPNALPDGTVAVIHAAID